ncbi:hypothetical protein WA538_002858, partial [Blastocystis sp. DL]
MIPSFGWSTVGAEQNDPDTVNNLLFGHIEATPTFSDVLADQLDDSSSFGLLGSSKSDDGLPFPVESPLQKMDSLQLPTGDSFYHGEFPQVDLNPVTNDIHSEVSIPPLVPEIPSQPLPLPTVVPPQPSPLPGAFPTYRQAPRPTVGAKKKLHNTSEKRRVERMNMKIDELYNIITSTGTMINKSKINILMESVKFLRHLETQIKDLREQTKKAEERATKRMGQVNEVVQSQRINYHVLFLQSPVPMAILSTDGQFVDANSQFCCLTRSTLDVLKTMTLFRFTHPEDLPCAFGSYSYMLHSKLEAPSQCIIRHCVIGGNVQPVYFSLSLIRNKRKEPAGFVCIILPVLSCDCTGNCSSSRQCSGQLKSPQGNYYLICNPPDTIPCCSQLIGAISGEGCPGG